MGSPGRPLGSLGAMLTRAGEELLFHGHPSWRSMPGFHVKGLLGAVLIGAVAGLISALVDRQVQVTWVMLAVLVVLGGVLAGGLLQRMRTTYTITDQRLTIERGLMTRELYETRL